MSHSKTVTQLLPLLRKITRGRTKRINSGATGTENLHDTGFAGQPCAEASGPFSEIERNASKQTITRRFTYHLSKSRNGTVRRFDVRSLSQKLPR